MSGNQQSAEKRYQGVGVSPGLARGSIFVHRPDDEMPPVRQISESEIPAEIARFETALISTRAQILEMITMERNRLGGTRDEKARASGPIQRTARGRRRARRGDRARDPQPARFDLGLGAGALERSLRRIRREAAHGDNRFRVQPAF